MKSMVVFFAVVAVAYGSLVPLAQPINHPALVLDPRGRPLETEEVINSRSLHLQAKALEGTYGHGYSAGIAPAYSYGATAPLLGHSALGYAAPHYLYKRSLGLTPVASQGTVARINHAAIAPIGQPAAVPAFSGYNGYGAPHYLHKRSLGHYAGHSGAAVSHQSRLDVISSPAVVPQAVAAPLVAHTAPLAAHGAVLPAASHGNWARINHAAIAPITQPAAVPAAVPAFSGYHGYAGAAPLINAW